MVRGKQATAVFIGGMGCSSVSGRSYRFYIYAARKGMCRAPDGRKGKHYIKGFFSGGEMPYYAYGRATCALPTKTGNSAPENWKTSSSTKTAKPCVGTTNPARRFLPTRMPQKSKNRGTRRPVLGDNAHCFGKAGGSAQRQVAEPRAPVLRQRAAPPPPLRGLPPRPVPPKTGQSILPSQIRPRNQGVWPTHPGARAMNSGIFYDCEF